MKICAFCGTENDNFFQICKKCGKPLSMSTSSVPTSKKYSSFIKIGEKELIQISDAISINGEVALEDIQARLEDVIAETDVVCEIGMGEICGGGLFSSYSSPCVTLKHPEHATDEYYGYCITVKANKSMSVATIYNFGSSKQMGKEEYLNNTRAFTGNGARSAVAGAFRGGAVGAGFAVGGMIGGAVGGSARLLKKGFAALTMDKAALEEEKNWYGLMNMVLQQAFFGE